MPYLYPEKTPLSNPGQKTYWGSLYGSADALALVEYAQQQSQVILLIANDIAHLDILYKSLNFYNDTLDILKFDNWEVLPYDQFSPHPGGIPGYRARIRPIVSRITIHWPSFYNVVTGKTLALPNLIALQHIPLFASWRNSEEARTDRPSQQLRS